MSDLNTTTEDLLNGFSENAPILPKRIDMTKTSFMANGKEYFITSHLSVSRFCEFQILEKEVAFSMTFDNVFKEINEACELFDGSKSFGDFAQARIKLDNLRRGIAKLEDKEPSALKLCTLFINAKDEDPSFWNNDLMTQKIEDWKIEGIDVSDFFQLALNTLNGFTDIYQKISDRLSAIGTKESPKV